MNDIGLVLTADARAMIKALKDAEGSLKTFSVKTEADLMKMQKAAQETDKVLSGMGQGLSTSQVNKGLTDMNRNLAATGMTAKQTAASLRGVPAQITDIVVSLQGGQNPMTVFLQQGGQLKDMFGGVVPAAKALTTSLIGMINPFTLVAAAVVTFGAAIRAAGQEQQAFRMAIANTGNAAGVTVDQMNGMADAMGQGFGRTAGKARDALTAMANTGQVARADLQQFAQVAIDVERVTGQSLEKTAENFAALGKDPLGASLRLSGSMNYLTVETYKQIKAAQELGNTQQAAAIAQQAYADAEEARITRAAQGVGYIDLAWKAVTAAAVTSWNLMKEAWDWLKSIGRDEPLTQQLAAAEKTAAELQNIVTQYSGTAMAEGRKKELADKLALIESIKEQIKLSKMAGDAEAGRVAANTKGIKALIEEEKNASKVKAEAERKAREAEAARKEAAREAAKERQKELDVGILRNKLVEENAKAEIKLVKDAQKAHEDSLKPYLQAAKAAEDRVKSLETEEEALKISKSMNVSLAQAVEMVNIAKLKEKQIEAMGNEDAVAAIQTEIEAREKLVELIGSKEARDAPAKAAKQAATDWQRASERIQDSITNALMRGFESGKGFAQALKDTVINMFKTLVLRPVIQGVVGGVMGMGATGASAAGLEGLISGAVSGGISKLAGAITLGGSSLAAIGSSIATGFMTTIGGGSVAAASTAYTAAGMTGVATGLSTGAMAAMAVPYVAAAALALNALGVFRSNKVVGGGLTGTLGAGDINTYDLNRRGGSLFSGPSYSIQNVRQSPESKAIQEAFGIMRTATAGMAAQLGLANESILNFTTRLGDDLIHPDTGGYGITLDGLNPEQAAAKVHRALSDANELMARNVLQSYKETEARVTRFFGGSFNRTTTSDGTKFMREGETAAQTLQRLSSSLNVVNGVFATMNQTLLATSLRGADVASKLLDVFGGIENFTQATGAYYQAFYTEAERNAKITEQLTNALGDMGLQLPASISAYRQLVEAQNLNTEAGRKNYAALIQLGPAFAQVTPAAIAAAEGVAAFTRSAQDIANERADLLQQLLEEQGDITAIRAAERADLDESNRALFDQIQALRDQKEAAEKAAEAENQRIEAMKSATNSVIEEIRRLRGLDQALGNAGSLQAQFAILTAQAKAGDSAALSRLPEITRAIEEAALTSAKTSRELAYTRAMLAVSLSDTVTSLGGTVPAFAAGGLHSGGLRLVGENGPELEITGPARYYSAAETSSMMGGGMVDELRGLREEVAMLRAEARATAINTGRTQDIMKRITKNGESMIVSTDGEALKVTAP